MISWEIDAERVLTLTIDDPSQSTNTMTEQFADALIETTKRLEAQRDSFDGVIITSGKDTFFAGGDLALLMNSGPADVDSIAAGLNAYKDCFRRIETLGKPVVAAINGTALGGGFEVALAAHHRIALDARGSKLGLPEVTLGVLPGAGGVTRTVRLLGIVNALLTVVGTGPQLSPSLALQVGIVDAVASSREEMFSLARQWIIDNPDARQPWDVPGYRIPGGTPGSPTLATQLPALPANVRKEVKGAPMPAPAAVLATAVEGAQVDIDTAFAIETRYCTHLICGQVSTNMIKALFFDLNRVKKGIGRPGGIAPTPTRKVAVLGAGMMGAAIAYVAARGGVEVVLRDLTLDAAERGKDYSRNLLDKAVAKGRMDDERRAQVLDRILTTDTLADVAGVDLVIEAVFEDIEVKKKVFTEVQEYVDADTVIATNTSAIPLSEMVDVIDSPANFVGMHFFSPVEKMPLLEIVIGAHTGERGIARAYDFAKQISKTAIAVDDVYAFYANRVIAQFVDQAVSMLAEGLPPSSIEQAALQGGFPVGPLALLDEVNMKTTLKIARGAVDDAKRRGVAYVSTPGDGVQARMVEELDRPGRLAGRGFYDYADDGRRVGLWPQLSVDYGSAAQDPSGSTLDLVDMTERMLFAASLEAARCYEAGIIGTVPEANVGSILGIGFPVWTGGTLQYINQYAGGISGFVTRAQELQAKFGDRFAVPAILDTMASSGTQFV